MTLKPLAAALAIALATSSAVAGVTPVTVKILAFNDFHGNLVSPGTYRANVNSPAVPAGGIDELAGYVAAARAANPNTVVVSAGDVLGASPLVSALFHDEPTIETMNVLGLDFDGVGNHEFDDGSAELLRMQHGGCFAGDANTCQGQVVGTPYPFEGAKFRFLAANVVVDATGKTLFPKYRIKNINGVHVAFIGMTLKETPTIVTPAGVAGLTFNDEVETVNKLVPHLRKQGVDAIVVLMHQGGFQDITANPSITDINACASADGSNQLDNSDASVHLRSIIAGFQDGVDLVISGHTHAAYNCMLPNSAGRRIPVTSASAFGRVLTDIDLTIDRRQHAVSSVVATNKVVDRTNTAIVPNAQIKSIVDNYLTIVSPIANQVIGSITTDVTNAKDPACNMPAGNLIADSQLAATAGAGLGDAVLAFMNPGGVRASFAYAGSAAGEGDGNVTYGEAFTVQPFGNSLVTMTVTTQDIKDALEQQFAGCSGQSTTKVLLPSAGFKYQFDDTKACGTKVSSVTLSVNGAEPVTLVDAAGVVQNPAQPWRITVNNFLSTGGDGFAVFKRGTDTLGGAQDIDALSAYLAGCDVLTGHAAYDPNAVERGNPRMTRLDAGASCPL
jgi:5'-nucleotidase